jgi:predicted NAD/FAD-binding protein
MKKLGIVGGGITGLTCAYKLQSQFEVTLFEKGDQLGGQAQTHYFDDIAAEAAVSVMSAPVYPDFYKLMDEIGFNDLENYGITGLRVRDGEKIKLYFDTNLKRLIKLFPKFLSDTPLGIYRLLQIIPFIFRLYKDQRKGKLENILVEDAYEIYPQYAHLITNVLNILSLITAVSIKNIPISHILNFAFDFNRNPKKVNPALHLIKMFMHTDAPKNGVSEYVQKLRQSSKAKFIESSEIKRVVRNSNKTVSIFDQNNQEHIFDSVIVATQPFQIASFLEYQNTEEEKVFEQLSQMATYTLVTNHQDQSILGTLETVDGLVDYRFDKYENCNQFTITRYKHFYTAQTLPDSFQRRGIINKQFIDTGVTPDNYSVDPDKILSQHIHGVPYMCPESKSLHKRVLELSGKENLHFACAALSDFPTSQEGGVRSALRLVNAFK